MSFFTVKPHFDGWKNLPIGARRPITEDWYVFQAIKMWNPADLPQKPLILAENPLY